MNKSAIGIAIGVSVLGIVGIIAVMYQGNFENLNGLPQTDSTIGLTDEIQVTVEKISEEQSKTDSTIGFTDEVQVTVEKISEEQNNTVTNKSYEFIINETIGFSTP